MQRLKRTISALVLGTTLGAAVLPASMPASVKAQDLTFTQYDLRPKVTQIINAIKQQLGSATPGRPLVVLLGENHKLPADIMVQRMVLEEFAKLPEAQGKKFAVGLEGPHNMVHVGLNRALNADLPVEMSGWLEFLDPYGRNALRMSLATTRDESAPMAHNALYSYLLESKISTSYNDVARKGQFIDVSEPGTGRLIPRALHGTPINIKSGQGQNYRNLIIAANAKNHMRIHDVAVYFQMTGTAHLFGDRVMGADYPHSITAQFKANGFKVLPVVLSADVFTPDIPANADAAGLYLKGTSPQKFEISSMSDTPSMRSELKAMQDICVASGRLKDCFNANVANFPYREEVKREYPQWIALAQAAQRAAAAEKRRFKP